MVGDRTDGQMNMTPGVPSEKPLTQPQDIGQNMKKATQRILTIKVSPKVHKICMYANCIFAGVLKALNSKTNG